MTMESESTTVDPALLPEMEGANDYDESNIQHLQDADHIRKRPGNYIPDTGARGLHHLVYELVYNSVDEALGGYCQNIVVEIGLDNTVKVVDDGRGIPVDEHPVYKRPTLELVLTAVGSSGKFDNNAYKVSAGLHGMGAKAVTALSEHTEARIRRNGKTYVQEYERGKASTPVKEIGPADRTGTTITFRPDPEIFGDATFIYETLEDRLRELAFLNRGLAITLKDERDGKHEKFHYDGGVAEFVVWLNRNEEILHPPIYIEKTVDMIQVQAALQYTTGDHERVRAYANNAYNPTGGTHLSGFRAAVTRTLNAYGEKGGMFKGDLKPVGEDFREGLTAVINVQLPNPQFESQTKVRLNNPEVEGVVASVVNEVLAKHLEENPKDAQRIIKKVLLAAEQREAAAKAREAARKRKNILSTGGLPGKLMDCTSKGDDSELFMVEGDSAGGTAESGRDRKFQAILPLRGKPLNVEKARFEHLLKNEEIVSIISAVGIDIGNPEDVSKVRYGKIIILTDADVDGQHIRTLLLTFFFRQMRKLVEEGYIYVARPPLYKVEIKKQKRFIQTAGEMTEELLDRGLRNTTLEVVSEQHRKIEDEHLKSLLKLLEEIEAGIQILERRGLTLAGLLPHAHDGALPMFRVKFANQDHWFHSTDEVDQFRQTESQRLGKELVIAESSVGFGSSSDGSANGTPEETEHHFFLQELNEIRSLNRALAKLHAYHFTVQDLVPLERVAGREPPIRYYLVNGDTRKALHDLRALDPEVRRLGEKGWSVTRFKGLGEMDADELWDTTLDPEKRNMLRVSLADAQKADDMFRTLMGDEVEGRRKFIFQHGIDLKDIDYGA